MQRCHEEQSARSKGARLSPLVGRFLFQNHGTEILHIISFFFFLFLAQFFIDHESPFVPQSCTQYKDI